MFLVLQSCPLFTVRPLPAELVHYAREDTHYLLYIYDRMHAELLTRGNNEKNLLRAVYDRSRLICSKVRADVNDCSLCARRLP